MNTQIKNESFFRKHGMMAFFVLLIAASCFPQLGMERYEVTTIYILGSIGALIIAFAAIGKLWRYTKLDRGLLLILQSCAIGGQVWVLQNPQLTYTGRIGPLMFCVVMIIVNIISIAIVWSLGRMTSE